jgi:hypothetical protein
MAKRQSTQPYLNHDTLTQAQQARFLGSKPETVSNLGDDTTVDKLTENPVRKVPNYENSNRVVEGPTGQTGVYTRFDSPRDGHDFSGWASRTGSNTYSVDGRGRDPKGRGAGSDNHLASTKGWARFDSGAESGEGRLEKSRK